MTDILIKIGAVLALLAALFYGEQYIEGRGYDRRAAEDAAAMGLQKKRGRCQAGRPDQRKAHRPGRAGQPQIRTGEKP